MPAARQLGMDPVKEVIMERHGQAGRELAIGLSLGLIVIAVAAYWMWAASRNAVPFVLALGLPNNLVINLVILVILAVIIGVVFANLRRHQRQ
jgi:hypothetical protein